MSDKINDMAEFIGTAALQYGSENEVTHNQAVNAMAVAYVILAYSLKDDNADLDKLKANLIGAVADVFDSIAEASHAKA
jgi:hypothetical protein